MKKMIGVLLTLVLLMNAVIAAPVSASDDGIMPYANYTSTTCELTCGSSGYAMVRAAITSNSYTAGGTIYTYIQVLDGGKWETIDNGQPNDKWVDSFDENGRIVTHYMYLPHKGTYRAVAVFYVRSTVGIADTSVKNSNTCTY